MKPQRTDTVKTLKVVTLISLAISLAMITGVFLAYGKTGIVPTDDLTLALALMAISVLGIITLNKRAKPKARRTKPENKDLV